ncbi:unnamed protein product [Vitrella brassicaformis CCMP3155]|uniref:Cyclin N-terminal domain-containing protein n=1 Tax=Vitrella brassicaformis (strain CCMP3155) TaxID=1169540 RepID=A0A0G4ESN5_VITBC|nr:unnamed protein product [Vitrella brassicaformis CCMP3155]|eukprot:CEM00886.1 unnamed protein product [Vitrella brassicaformis CCMP3155]
MVRKGGEKGYDAPVRTKKTTTKTNGPARRTTAGPSVGGSAGQSKAAGKSVRPQLTEEDLKNPKIQQMLCNAQNEELFRIPADWTRYEPDDPTWDEIRVKIAKRLLGCVTGLNMRPSTVFFAMRLFDRFWYKVSMLRWEDLNFGIKLANTNYSVKLISNTYLVAHGCLWLGAKLMEAEVQVAAKHIKVLNKASPKKYTEQCLENMEWCIFEALDFNLASGNEYTYVEVMSKTAGLATGSKALELAHRITELALLSFNFVKYTPRIIAAAAVCVARHLELHAKGAEWTDELVHLTRLTASDISGCVQEMASYLPAHLETPDNTIKIDI